jgi:HAD superfamily hydrolase (TIGR01509 family)
MRLQSGSELLDLSGVAAFVFDLDGTLINSEPVWAAAKTAIAAARGISVSAETLQGFVGRSLGAFVAEALAVVDPDEARGVARDIERRALRDYGARVVPIPGAARLVRALHRAGFRIAICSSAPSAIIATSLDLLSLGGVVELTVSAAALPQGKPHRAPYVEVLARIGLGPQAVIAVEDAPAGIQSATAAGLRTVTVGPETGVRTSPLCVLHAERIADLAVLG